MSDTLQDAAKAVISEHPGDLAKLVKARRQIRHVMAAVEADGTKALQMLDAAEGRALSADIFPRGGNA